MAYNEKREHARNLIVTEVEVNQDSANPGGVLLNMSPRGAAVLYSHDADQSSEMIVVGQDLLLKDKGGLKMPGTVSRVFKEGFATQFKSSIPVIREDLLVRVTRSLN